MRLFLTIALLVGLPADQEQDQEVKKEPLQLRLSSAHSLWRGEGALPVRFLLENGGKKTIQLPEPTDYREGLQITGPDGRVIKLSGKTRDVVRTFEAPPGTFHGITLDLSRLITLPEKGGGDGPYTFVWNFFGIASPPLSILVVRDYRVLLQTSMGDLSFALQPELAPRHVLRFIKLAREGAYEGSSFHRLIPGFMVQGGRLADTSRKVSPLKGEFSPEPHIRGTLSMARAGHPDSARTEFFICFSPRPHLDGYYTVFGKMTEGENVLARIEAAPTDHSPCKGCGANLPSGPTEHCGKKGHHMDVPLKDIVIKKMALELRKPLPEEAPKKEE